jgi:hypothetical protein
MHRFSRNICIFLVFAFLISNTSCLNFANTGTKYKKGWLKNSNNPHHPRTTNPGHTKPKPKGKVKR